METPSSARRITRSQAAAVAACSNQKSKQDDSYPRPRNAGDRSVLVDITNDSPVVGLAAGSLVAEKTPTLSSALKSRVSAGRTPGSGEEVLRGQVRTLLQKVEEDAELVNKRPFGIHHPPPPPPPSSLFPALLSHLRSPLQLLAPTPANTPQMDFMEVASPCVLSQFGHPKAAEDSINPVEILGECQINRALMFDSPEKSDISESSTISSSLTAQFSSESFCQEKSADEDNSSIWSIQVNASAKSDSEDELLEDLEGGEEEEEKDEEGDDADAEEENIYNEEAEKKRDEEEHDLLAGLCEGMKKTLILGDKTTLPGFTGKHIKFVYNSDDEMEGVVVKEAASSTALVLKGLPVPEGKHLRFHDPDEEE